MPPDPAVLPAVPIPAELPAPPPVPTPPVPVPPVPVPPVPVPPVPAPPVPVDVPVVPLPPTPVDVDPEPVSPAVPPLPVDPAPPPLPVAASRWTTSPPTVQLASMRVAKDTKRPVFEALMKRPFFITYSSLPTPFEGLHARRLETTEERYDYDDSSCAMCVPN